MVYDFNQTCKTYDKTFYTRAYFEFTPCPACPAVGRFSLHGSYERNIIYFDDGEIVCRLMEIKRVKCASCKATHAVMPGDIIPYKILSLFVFVHILVSFFLEKASVLKMAGAWDFSFQFIYSVIHAFHRHANNIRQYIREVSCELAPSAIDACGILDFITNKSGAGFQAGYTRLNRRPCFMGKFFCRAGAPPIGIYSQPRLAT